MFFSSLKKYLRLWQQSIADQGSQVNLPLVSKQELLQIRQHAKYMLQAPWLLQETALPWLGEYRSPQTGRGYDFEENRLYSMGDDPRYANWRLYARTQQLYSKSFREEHRPALYIIMDRRAEMRFGTHKQLKVQLAAKLAYFYCCLAMYKNIGVGGMIIDDVPHWLPVRHNQLILNTFEMNFNMPCPPLPAQAHEIKIGDILQQLHAALKPGHILLFISDFHDLGHDDTGNLWGLARLHNLSAVHIIDPAEITLPNGCFNLHSFNGGLETYVDMSSPASRERLGNFGNYRLNHTQSLFKKANAQYHRYTTDMDVFAELPS